MKKLEQLQSLDINLEDYSIDLDKLEAELNKYKGRNKSLVITDYAGHPSNWERIFRKKKYKLKIINDNCHAMGAKINKDKGYAIKYSDISILAFISQSNYHRRGRSFNYKQF